MLRKKRYKFYCDDKRIYRFLCLEQIIFLLCFLSRFAVHLRERKRSRGRGEGEEEYHQTDNNCYHDSEQERDLYELREIVDQPCENLKLNVTWPTVRFSLRPLPTLSLSLSMTSCQKTALCCCSRKQFLVPTLQMQIYAFLCFFLYPLARRAFRLDQWESRPESRSLAPFFCPIFSWWMDDSRGSRIPSVNAERDRFKVDWFQYAWRNFRTSSGQKVPQTLAQ